MKLILGEGTVVVALVPELGIVDVELGHGVVEHGVAMVVDDFAEAFDPDDVGRGQVGSADVHHAVDCMAAAHQENRTAF